MCVWCMGAVNLCCISIMEISRYYGISMLKTLSIKLRKHRNQMQRTEVRDMLKRDVVVMSRQDATILAIGSAAVMIVYMAVRFFYLRDLFGFENWWNGGILSFWIAWIGAVTMNVTLDEKSRGALSVRQLMLFAKKDGMCLRARAKKFWVAYCIVLVMFWDMIFPSRFSFVGYEVWVHSAFAYAVISFGYISLRRMYHQLDFYLWVIFVGVSGIGCTIIAFLGDFQEHFAGVSMPFFLGMFLIALSGCGWFLIHTKWE